jgi:hypothetical protein
LLSSHTIAPLIVQFLRPTLLSLCNKLARRDRGLIKQRSFYKESDNSITESISHAYYSVLHGHNTGAVMGVVWGARYR